MILSLAEILRLEEFWKADDFRPASRRFGNPAESLVKILFRLRSARHLDQGHTEFFRRQTL